MSTKTKKTLGTVVAVFAILASVCTIIKTFPLLWDTGRKMYAVTDCPDRITALDQRAARIESAVSEISRKVDKLTAQDGISSADPAPAYRNDLLLRQFPGIAPFTVNAQPYTNGSAKIVLN